MLIGEPEVLVTSMNSPSAPEYIHSVMRMPPGPKVKSMESGSHSVRTGEKELEAKVLVEVAAT